MSRIGKLPVEIPDKVTITVEGNSVTVEGPRGKLSRTFPEVVDIAKTDSRVTVAPRKNSRFARSMHGTARSLIANMVKGVVEGYRKDLEIRGVGYRAVLTGRTLDMNLGYSHPAIYPVPDGVEVTVKDNTRIKVEGIDKQLVGEVAASIRRFYPPEPYKGRGVRIVGEYVRRKEGKTAG